MFQSNVRFLLAGIFSFWFSIAPLSTYAAAGASATTELARNALPRGSAKNFGPAPKVSNTPLSDETIQALDTLFSNLDSIQWHKTNAKAVETVAQSGDPRLAWLIADIMRFITAGDINKQLTNTAEQLLDKDFKNFDVWHRITEHLIAWDIPAPPNYLHYKRKLFSSVLPKWETLFSEGDIDWRHVTWGGVRIDDRAFDNTDEPCNCIPAADNPNVVKAKDATWPDDNDVVFGIGVNGEYRAYPRQIMEVREMVNDTLGGRHLGIPYCTLCGSAQAWFTDDVPAGIERPILRTSGLLIRSNKVMYDLNTMSVLDTFRGKAVTGPLFKSGLQLKQADVVTTTWGEWKRAHPETTVLIKELALDRDFDFRNGRDANGPIFPIGDYDPRLAVHEDVLGVITNSGVPWAFHVPSLIKVLDAGETVTVEDVKIVLDAGGVRAINNNGESLGTHQAFWFAWSQFYPKTKLWPL